MIRVLREIKSFDGVGMGAKPQVKLAGGPTYHEIILDTNLTAAQVVRVSLFLNGDPIVQLTGEQMLMLERYKKQYETGGRFVLPLADISGRSIEGQAITGLVTFPSDNLILQVEVADGTAPSPSLRLRADALVSANTAERASIPRITTLTFNAGANGRNILDTLPNNGQMIRRMHLLGAVEHLRIRKDKHVVFEASAALNTFHAQRRGRAPQPGYFHFDPVVSGYILAEMMDTRVRESLEFEMDVSTPGNIAILMETLEPLTTAATA